MTIDNDVTEVRSKKRKRNRLRRLLGVVTGVTGTSNGGEVWVVLTPAPADDEPSNDPPAWTEWSLRPDPAAPDNTGDPARRFLFATESAARRIAEAGDEVEGPLPVLPPDTAQVKVSKVVVHFTNGTEKTYPGDKYDAVFWSEAAREKFVVPYGATMGLAMMSLTSTEGSLGHERWSKTSRP